MNFFEHQDLARRLSRRLLFLFLLAVICVVLAVDVVALVTYGYFARGGAGHAIQWPMSVIVVPTALTLMFIIGGSWFEFDRLRAGGAAVAEQLGARAVDSSTPDPRAQRLVNIVQEMALASGIAVPRVYVLPHEAGINAFAAGFTIDDAVIAVTDGALTQLNRDQLQGVIAHEFSHILHGDMRLNTHLIGVLAGLLMISSFGRFLAYRDRAISDERANTGFYVIALIGAALWAIGYIGVVFGRMIKAAVSRQREYLADASAVQFTRNPDGIGSALRVIGGLSDDGSAVHHPYAEMASHLFFGPYGASLASGWQATHPPLAERIRRIYGRSMAFLAPAAPAPGAAEVAPLTVAPMLPPLEFASAGVSAFADAHQVSARVGAVAVGAVSNAAPAQPLTPALIQASLDSVRAPLLVVAMVIEKNSPFADAQRAMVKAALGIAAESIVDDFHRQVQTLGPGQRLPLLDLAMPLLRSRSDEENARLLRLVQTLAAADGVVSLQEFMLMVVLRRRLDPAARQGAAVRFKQLDPLRAEIEVLLSLLAALVPNSAHAFAAGAQVLPALALQLQARALLTLPAIENALARTNQLAPLLKPQIIKACAAVAFAGDDAAWRARSCLRTVCVALDAPLPPRLASDGTP